MYADVRRVRQQPRRGLVVKIGAAADAPRPASRRGGTAPAARAGRPPARNACAARACAFPQRFLPGPRLHMPAAGQNIERRRAPQACRPGRDARGLQNRLQLARPHHRVHFRNVLAGSRRDSAPPGIRRRSASSPAPSVLWRAISRIVSTDSCLAVSIKLQVFTTRISASSGRAVSRAPARSSRPIITSESTRFLGQPNEIKPTVGAVGRGTLLTYLF